MAFDPLSVAGLTSEGGLLGTAVSLFGSLEAGGYEKKVASDQAQIATVSQGITQDEMQQNTLKMTQAGLMRDRQGKQLLRKQQQAYAMTMAQAASTGAQYGSAVGGARGAVAGQANNAIEASAQNWMLGQEDYSLTQDISNQKIKISGLQGDAATQQGNASFWQGIAGLGGGITGASGNIGKLFGQGPNVG